MFSIKCRLSIKVLFFTFYTGLIIFYILPSDEFGMKCGGEKFVPFIIGILMVVLPFIIAIIEVIKRKTSALTFVTIFIILILISLIYLAPRLLVGCRCAPRWKVPLANMNQLAFAQEEFYKKYNRYADTQEELIKDEEVVFPVKLKDRATGKEFTDKDGKGIEGGDMDPKTWSATVYMQYKEFNLWCIPIEKKYWYTCNQNGCFREK